MASFNQEGSLQINPPGVATIKASIRNAQNVLQVSLTRLRRNRWNILAIPLFCIAFLWLVPLRPPLPPSYSHEWKEERWLEQMDFDSEMEGKVAGRFVNFAPIKEEGFNYQLQSLIFQQEIAFLANRSLAYQPYHVHDSVFPISPFHWPLRSTRIPMTAMVWSVASGFEGLFNRRRGVPLKHFSDVCSASEIQHVELHVDTAAAAHTEEAVEMMYNMARKLQDQSLGRCVEISINPFDREFFESHFPEALYPSLSQSPVVRQFSFSPRVLAIINRSLDLLSPDAKPYADEIELVKRPRKDSPWKNLLALHLRKSTDPNYCSSLGERSAPFVGFNKLPKHPGNENVPAPAGMVPAARQGLYLAKCDPPILEIIARARRMRVNHPQLRSIYILSNGDDSGFVAEARKWLESDGWDRVLTSSDVAYKWDDREVIEAVDTEIARRSGVFVGNGFSALSSNVALLRDADGRHTDFTQYW